MTSPEAHEDIAQPPALQALAQLGDLLILNARLDAVRSELDERFAVSANRVSELPQPEARESPAALRAAQTVPAVAADLVRATQAINVEYSRSRKGSATKRFGR